MGQILSKLWREYLVLLAIIILPFLIFYPSLSLNTFLVVISTLVSISLAVYLTSVPLQDLSFGLTALKWIQQEDLPELVRAQLPVYQGKYGVQFTKIGVYENAIPILYTYGLKKESMRLVLSSGFLKNLSEAEQRALLMNQVGRSVNGDCFVVTFLNLFPTIFVLVIEILKEFKKQSAVASTEESKDKISGISYGVWFFLFVSQAYVLYLKRKFDLRADRFTVQELKNPQDLVQALASLQFGEPGSFFQLSSHHVFAEGAAAGIAFNKSTIEKKIKWDLVNPWAPVYELLSAHALLGKRVENIIQVARGEDLSFNLNLPKERTQLNFKLLAAEFAGFLSFISLVVVGIVLQFLVIPSLHVSQYFSEHWPVFIGFSSVGFYLFIRSFYKIANFPKTTISDLFEDENTPPLRGRPATLEASMIGAGTSDDQQGIRFRARDENAEVEIIGTYLTINEFASAAGANSKVTIQGIFRRIPHPGFEALKVRGSAGDIEASSHFIFFLAFVVFPICYYPMMYMFFVIR